MVGLYREKVEILRLMLKMKCKCNIIITYLTKSDVILRNR